MTICSIFGVSIGVAALIIVLSVMGGFEKDLKQKMLDNEPHLEVQHKSFARGFSLKKYPIEKFRSILPGANINSYTKADIVVKNGKYLSTAMLLGIDPTQTPLNWSFSESMIEGDIGQIGHGKKSESGNANIILGETLKIQLGVNLGEEISIFSPQIDSADSLLSGATIAKTYTVVGTFFTGQLEFDAKWAIVNISEGRKFLTDYDESLDEDQYVTGLGIKIPDPLKIDYVVQKLSHYKDLALISWKKSNSAILFALTLEKYTMGAILLLIIVVAAFSISGTIMMMVFHKQVQVCLFRAIGMTRKGVTSYFVLQGVWIGIIGIILGNLIGLSSCYLLYYLKSSEIPASINSLTALPVKFLPVEYVVINVLALILSIGGAFYPALIASRKIPSSGLRFG